MITIEHILGALLIAGIVPPEIHQHKSEGFTITVLTWRERDGLTTKLVHSSVYPHQIDLQRDGIRLEVKSYDTNWLEIVVKFLRCPVGIHKLIEAIHAARVLSTETPNSGEVAHESQP